MGFHSLKQSFLAAMPVVGPHADIECELLLAGKKPLGWLSVEPDDAQFENPRIQKEHEGRKKLDQAVKEGKLISCDVEINRPEGVTIIRHYAQPGQEETLKKIAAFNKAAFNSGQISPLDGDMGDYLGYRKRDILLFTVLQSKMVPGWLSRAFINWNASSQSALRNKLLTDAGYDIHAWYKNLPKIGPS